LRPEGCREHSAEFAEGIDVPLEKCVQDGFGIAVGAELMTGLGQFLAQVRMVIELAIEYQHRVAVVGGHGLVPAFEIDNAEPDGSQRHFR